MSIHQNDKVNSSYNYISFAVSRLFHEEWANLQRISTTQKFKIKNKQMTLVEVLIKVARFNLANYNEKIAENSNTEKVKKNSFSISFNEETLVIQQIVDALFEIGRSVVFSPIIFNSNGYYELIYELVER